MRITIIIIFNNYMFTNLLINFYFNVHNFRLPFTSYFISFLSEFILHHGNFFRLIGPRANKSQGQVQRSHSIPLVVEFYVLILIYFRAIFMEIWNLFEYIYLVLIFVTFWYFASRLWKSLLFLTHTSWAFAWVFCMRFAVIWTSF